MSRDMSVMPIGEWRNSEALTFLNRDQGRPVLGRPITGNQWNPTWRERAPVRGQNNNLMGISMPSTSVREPIRPVLPQYGADVQPGEQNIVNGILHIIRGPNTSELETGWNIESAMNSMSLGPDSSGAVPDSGRMDWYEHAGGVYHTPSGRNQSRVPQARSPVLWDSGMREPNGDFAHHPWSSYPRGNNNFGKYQPRTLPTKFANDPSGLPNGVARTKWFHCALCDCKVNSEYQMRIHNEGVKHRKRLSGKQQHISKNFDMNGNVGTGRNTFYQRQTTAELGPWFSLENAHHPSLSTNFENFQNLELNGLRQPTNVNFWSSTPTTADANPFVTRDGSWAMYDVMPMKRPGYDSDSQYGSDDESHHSSCSGIEH